MIGFFSSEKHLGECSNMLQTLSFLITQLYNARVQNEHVSKRDELYLPNMIGLSGQFFCGKKNKFYKIPNNTLFSKEKTTYVERLVKINIMFQH